MYTGKCYGGDGALVNQSESHKTCPSASPSPFLCTMDLEKGFLRFHDGRDDDDAEFEGLWQKRKVCI